MNGNRKLNKWKAVSILTPSIPEYILYYGTTDVFPLQQAWQLHKVYGLKMGEHLPASE